MSSTPLPTAAPRLLIEPASPFAEAELELPRLESLLPPERPSLLGDLYGAPGTLAGRLLDREARAEVVRISILAIVIGTALFAVLATSHLGAWGSARAALLLAANTFLGLMGALGPIYATGLLVAARLPLSRWVGVLLSGAASSALLLGALAPIAHLAFRIDPLWAGPLSLAGAFLVAGLSGGVRLYRVLHALAAAVRGEALRDGELFRLKIQARMALVFTALTGALGLWAFDPFLGG
ncbi:MAG: hypothetical protein IPG45_14970 [Deltaproteobacteria bacterium]|jgi:MFS family permease|nr:hypothetical protein [Deltaproteobacteria bacterium]